METADNLGRLKDHIRQLEQLHQRTPGSVQLLAVSKAQPVEKIIQAYDAGQRLIGENYLQEAEEKITQLQDKHIEWHFIGNIQSNKTRRIAELFSWVQSVDSLKHAQRLNNQRPQELGPLNICLEVNLDHEISKSGASTQELLELAQICQQLPMLTLRGLMAIPHKAKHVDEQRASFKKLATLFDQLKQQGYKLDTLSMGMSGDYEAAIAEGSSMIRVGTGIFGQRKK